MTRTLRLFLLCSVAAACGDDGKTTASDTTSSTGSATAETTDVPGTPTTGDSTGSTGESTTNATVPGTTDASTTEPGTSVGTGTDTDTETTTDATTGAGISWAEVIYPNVIAPNCDCHTQGAGGLTMTDGVDSYMNLVGVASTEAPSFNRVAPGEPVDSYLLAKIEGVAGDPPYSGTPSQMPLGGPPLSPEFIALIEEWIVTGAAP